MLSLFSAFGVELEYMIVDRDTLDVRPWCDRLLVDAQGGIANEIECGPACWGNELVLHVVELKTNGPAADMAPLPAMFHQQVTQVNAALAKFGAQLMPTAMHPWMDPHAETHLWPHDSREIYDTFHRIFDCTGHGWANLQSVHLNLPFASDEEFAALHAGVRLLLPILPALAASSPIAERRLRGFMDYRMETYRGNARRVPSVSGMIVPEPVFTQTDYEAGILGRIYRDLEPHDPEGLLRYEWANARGAIARFDRGAIEIRVIDVQECPQADVAICQMAAAVLRATTRERFVTLGEQQAFATEPLHRILLATIRDADQAVIDDAAYLRALGMKANRATAGELWHHLLETVVPADAAWRAPLQHIVEHGPLARRIVNRLAGDLSHDRLLALYRDLCRCLADNRML